MQTQADWYIHMDLDEIRKSPWLDCSLRDGMYHVDQEGYNAIEFAVINFHPIDTKDYPNQPTLKVTSILIRLGI